jgi:hypothetical protein
MPKLYQDDQDREQQLVFSEIWDICEKCGAHFEGFFCSCLKRTKKEKLYFRSTLKRFVKENEFFPYLENGVNTPAP